MAYWWLNRILLAPNAATNIHTRMLVVAIAVKSAGMSGNVEAMTSKGLRDSCLSKYTKTGCELQR